MFLARWFLLVSCSLLLASCFVSAAPLISEKDADYPFSSGTRFSVQTLKQDGSPNGEVPQVITLTRKGAYYIYSAKDEKDSLKGLLNNIGKDTYVAYIQGEDGPLYVLFQKHGDIWLRHGLVCSDFEKLATAHGKVLGDFGITKKESDCSFADYADLKRALAFELEYGRPDAEYSLVK